MIRKSDSGKNNGNGILIPKIILGEKVSPPAKLVYGFVSYYDKELSTSNGYFASKTSLTTRTISGAISELKRSGWISSEGSRRRKLICKKRPQQGKGSLWISDQILQTDRLTSKEKLFIALVESYAETDLATYFGTDHVPFIEEGDVFLTQSVGDVETDTSGLDLKGLVWNPPKTATKLGVAPKSVESWRRKMVEKGYLAQTKLKDEFGDTELIVLRVSGGFRELLEHEHINSAAEMPRTFRVTHTEFSISESETELWANRTVAS